VHAAVYETPFGVIATLPVALEIGLERLAPEERARAVELPAPRRATWVAGRVALRTAAVHLGVTPPAILSDERGAPALPRALTGSISHKETIAVALATLRQGSSHVGVGVDVEYDRPTRVDVARRVLTDAERAALDGLTPEERDRTVRVAFALKEAIYKSIDPVCRRYVGFKEVELAGLSGLEPGEVVVRALLSPSPGALSIRAAWHASKDTLGTPVVIAVATAFASNEDPLGS
jgi:enterobactin synthetase component D